MGAQKQRRDNLRIGVIQGGRITEERLINSGEGVTIEKQKDGSFQFSVNEKLRGKVTLAGTTILFQFVPPAAKVAKLEKRKFAVAWFRRLDTTFAGIFAVSFIIHVTVMLYSLSLPRPKELTLEDVPNRFAQMIAPQIKKQVQEEVADGDGDKDLQEQEKIEEEKKDKKKPKTDEKADVVVEDQKPQLTEAQRKEKRKKELKQFGILKVLGSKFGGESSHGIHGEAVFETADGSGLGDLINRKAKGITTAATADQFGLRATSDTSLIGSGEVDGVGTDTEVETTNRVAKKVPKTKLGGDTDVFGSINKITLDSVINKNLRSVNACYDQALKLNPNIQGKIYIDFTVTTSGRVSKVDVRTTSGSIIDQSMIGCIQGRVKRWKFPTSEEGETDVTVPVVLTASSM